RFLSLSELPGFTPYFGDVWRGLVSPVLLYRGDTHGYTVSASHEGMPPPPCLPCTCRTATRCCDAPPGPSRVCPPPPPASVWPRDSAATAWAWASDCSCGSGTCARLSRG